MLSPPPGLALDELTSVLARAWGIAGASVDYRPVGFGSHHWDVLDEHGRRWFVTVDELEVKRLTATETHDAAFGRLRAALTAACELRETGATFAIAPVRTAAGEPLARIGPAFAAAVYPLVDGEAFGWGEFSSPEHRRAVFDLVLLVHAGPAGSAPVDGFEVPHRDQLELTLDGSAVPEAGPYAQPAVDLLRANAAPVRALLEHYDALVRQARPDRAVLTHGEPHPGNTMLTAAGWVLVDWDTALVAPPERDLWRLDPGDGTLLDAYADATGVVPEPAMLQLYRIRWDLTDLAIEAARFRRPHPGSADDAKGWTILRDLVHHLAGL